ncbi:MAG TPA: ABC transporter ATP-binding protein [Spirochaetota bacterium]|nr:ABC transporter ATP-binding protein [Spirochaetota bacterium]
MLKINNLACTVKNRKILDGINLEVQENEILGITGGPCCGKSLMLNVLSGNYDKYTGEILLNGRELRATPSGELKQAASLCSFTDRGYSPEATVFDTIISSRRRRKSIFTPYTDTDREDTARCIDQLRLTPYSNERLKNVSESVVRMSLIASSVMSECRLLLLDSPETGSGYRQRSDITAFIKKYAAYAEKTIIIASSDLNFLAACCDRIIVLENGKIAAEGNSEMIDEKFMKRFFNIEVMISRNVVTSLPEIHVIES